LGFDRLIAMSKRLKRWLSDPQQSALYKYFRGVPRAAGLSKEVVLVQCVEDLYCFGLFGQIVSSLRETQSVRVDQYVLRSLRVGESDSLLTFTISRLCINLLHSFKWVRLYQSFCDGVAYRSTSFRPIGDVIDLYLAWKCWRNLTDKDSFINMQISGIAVGDLINDSFLRFKPAPTVDLKDAYLLILLWQAHRDVRRARRYFARTKPKLYLTSYSTYIQHGIPVRVALQSGVRVFSFGNYQEFTKELTLQDWVHTKNPDGYASEFLKLDRQDERLAMAETALSTRLSGGVDSATAYMKKSAYAISGDPVPDVRGAVVIFLHDFYDSPHVYREMVFPDFWEWVCFTIEALRNANIRCFIKPHPNQISLSDNVLNELRQRYPGLSMISSSITNKQLAEAGMSCAVTVYGTVAHEMAYLGRPVIACAHNSHISFDFCRTAHSRDEYINYLRDFTQFPIDKVAMHQQSLIFYYMHNLNYDEESKSLRDAAMALRMACGATDEQYDLVDMFRKMTTLSGYQANIIRMICPIYKNGC
jgi:hypothetical protein